MGKHKTKIFLFVFTILVASSILLCLNWQKEVTVYLISAHDEPIILTCYSEKRVFFKDTLKQEIFLQSKFEYKSKESESLKTDIKTKNSFVTYQIDFSPLVYRHIVLLFYEDEDKINRVRVDKRLKRPIFQ
ncbi:MAG: hypothetical protein H6573_22830 [Lewinellaceae bacterium]|nr:hypothetical protein [Mangrovimonas sp.]MCB9350323.1 hypothetical protein [Lewinellaceae bacterium]